MNHPRVAVLIVFVIAGGMTGCVDSLPDNGTANATNELSSAAETVTPESGTVEIHYISVGQAASTLIISPEGETMLIDSGDFRTDGQEVLDYLEAQEIDRIDYLVTSHPDADHIGGHANLITTYETEKDGIGAIYDPGVTSNTQTYTAYLDAVETHNVTLLQSAAGDEIPLAGATATVLGPPEGYVAGGDPNENSLVVQLRHGEASFLFTGDAETEAEQYLVNEYGDQLQTTVMKAGHHGSASSTGEAILNAAQPQAVVISAPFDSQYGHPNGATLDRLAAAEVSTYWTATHGTVVLESNSTHVTVNTRQAASTDPLTLRDGTPIEPRPELDVAVTRRAIITASGGVTEATPAATDGGTPEDTGNPDALAIATINADADGADGDNLNDEFVVFENTGNDPLSIGGWTVQDAAGATYTVPTGTTLDPGATITLHTGSGTNTETDLYWGSGRPIWNNDGDTVTVITASGEVVLEEIYG